MLLAVFNEFAHPEVLEQVKAAEICDVDIHPHPMPFAVSENEKQCVRTNAKLIIVQHTIAAMSDAFESMTADKNEELQREVDRKLEALQAFGFRVEERYPKTSTGYLMFDRVILSLPA